MCHERSGSSLIIITLAAFVFGLVMAVFGTSQAAGVLTPKTGDQTEISIKSQRLV